MKINLIVFVFTIFIIGCKENAKKNIIKSQSDDKKSTNQETTAPFRDSTSAFLHLDSDQGGLITENYRNVSYNYISFNYKGEFKSAYKRQIDNIEMVKGNEGQKCEILVDLFDPETGKNLLSLQENADEIKLEYDYYVTSHSGCCGAENEGEIKNINTKETLLEFNEDYYAATIPNSKIKLFWGYKPVNRQIEDSKYVLNSGLVVGKLTYADLKGEINEVILHAADEYAYQGILHWTPEMRFNLSPKDKLRKKEAELWSNDGAKELKDINGVEFQIIFIHEQSGQTDTVKLPILNGFIKGLKGKKIDEVVKFRNM
ncbi:MAG TPA: hypothetical protein VIH57_21160 [Bacteroidales bacterium]